MGRFSSVEKYIAVQSRTRSLYELLQLQTHQEKAKKHEPGTVPNSCLTSCIT
ncbi:hypothetical protein SAMN03159341_12410 [Paenibacillus sp. 1_12]|nr:hypothetical protein SAMN03159341_12410 [Paenibacillus sp. 1_12]